MHVEKERLEKIDFYIEQAISTIELRDMQDVRFNTYIKNITEQMVLSLKSSVYGQKLDDCIYELDTPENWIEAIKERWFPKFLKKHFPVKKKTLRVKRMFIWKGVVVPDNANYYDICRYSEIDQKG